MTLSRLEAWSDASLVAFLGFGFIIAPEPSWAAWFYVLVMPFGAWFVWRGWRPDWSDPRLMLLLGLVVWSAMTLFWADTPRAPVFRQWLWVWNALCTGTFFLATTALIEKSPGMRDRVVGVVVGCGAANSLFSIVIFLSRHGGWNRLEGWAETRNAILGASIMGVCALLALGRSLRGGRWWPIWAASVPLFLAFIVLTGSRGPLIAVLLAGCVLLPRSFRSWGLVAAGVGAIVGLLALFQPEWLTEAVDRLADRGTSFRLQIWQESVSEIARRPIVGHGLTARLHIEGSFGHHPHDLYLSALFYSGAVGFLLLIGALIWIFRDVLRLSPSAERGTCLALIVQVVLSGATDLSQIVKGPGELWYIIWLPLAYVLGVLRAPATGITVQSAAKMSAKACSTVAARISARSPGKMRRSV